MLVAFTRLSTVRDGDTDDDDDAEQTEPSKSGNNRDTDDRPRWQSSGIRFRSRVRRQLIVGDQAASDWLSNRWKIGVRCVGQGEVALERAIR